FSLMTDDPEEPPPGMIGEPPSARHIPADPTAHALDFAKRYAEDIDLVVSPRMIDLGIDEQKIGTADAVHGIWPSSFHPHYRNAGAVSPDGRIIIGSGLFDSALMDYLGPETAKAWGDSRLTNRLNAAIAHEFVEGRSGSHDQAVEDAPETDLPIGGHARRLLR